MPTAKYIDCEIIHDLRPHGMILRTNAEMKLGDVFVYSGFDGFNEFYTIAEIKQDDSGIFYWNLQRNWERELTDNWNYWSEIILPAMCPRRDEHECGNIWIN